MWERMCSPPPGRVLYLGQAASHTLTWYCSKTLVVVASALAGTDNHCQWLGQAWPPSESGVSMACIFDRSYGVCDQRGKTRHLFLFETG